MAGIMVVFHNVAGADEAEARIRRHVGPFDKIRIENMSGGEEPLGPHIPLASAVLSAARQADRDSGPKGNDAPDAVGASGPPGEDYFGDEHLRSRLENLGVGAHRSDWYLKQVLHGYVVLHYKFETPDLAQRAWPVLERAGAISLERVTGPGEA